MRILIKYITKINYFAEIFFAMIITESRAWLTSRVNELKESDKKIGFAPTMGALHKGHISLIKKAVKENDICIVSIFINPKQFSNSKDLEKYPKTIKEDLSLLNMCLSVNDIVFIPSFDEIYNKHKNTIYDLGRLENIMEGKFREGHFQGVATVVNIFFDIIKPSRAYFGLKDYQQYLIIKRLVEITGLQIEIVPCKIIRENNGLAMSSRNKRLNKEQKQYSGNIFKALEMAKSLLKSADFSEIKNEVEKIIQSTPGYNLEYFEIVDSETLTKISDINSSSDLIACIAVYAGDIRLIDNIILK
jgi:pantoate--beta-alanine ligase